MHPHTDRGWSRRMDHSARGRRLPTPMEARTVSRLPETSPRGWRTRRQWTRAGRRSPNPFASRSCLQARARSSTRIASTGTRCTWLPKHTCGWRRERADPTRFVSALA
jgi:hypothetical protein